MLLWLGSNLGLITCPKGGKRPPMESCLQKKSHKETRYCHLTGRLKGSDAETLMNFGQGGDAGGQKQSSLDENHQKAPNPEN